MTPNLLTLRSTLPSYPVANPAYHCSSVIGGVGGGGGGGSWCALPVLRSSRGAAK